MKSKRGCRSSLTFPSSMFALGVGILFVVYIQTSHSASITVSSNPRRSSSSSSLDPVVAPANTSSPASTPAGKSPSPKSPSPSRITTLKARLGKPYKQKAQRKEVPRVEAPPQPPQQHQPGRMKASDIKACISRAFCEVNSASKVPNYAVNKEFFDLMNQIHAMSKEEEVDSGSTSVEYDEEEEEEEEDDDASSEESSSSERLRGRGYPPPPPGFRFSRNLKNGDNSTLYEPVSDKSNSTSATSTKVKGTKPTLIKKSGKKTKVSGKKTLKKYKNGTLNGASKRRRTRVEAAQEKAQQEAYLTRKQREMGQVNDLAALIRISADIGLTLRNPRKCRTLFNKCTMEHEQIVDLFNQTLMAVTTPATSNNAPDLSSSSTASFTVPTTKRAKVTSTMTTLAAISTTPTMSPSKPSSSTSANYYSELPSISVSTAMHSKLSHAPPTSSLFVTTQAPRTTTQDDNRSSKSRHDFSDEDVEYLTDTDLIQPVQTYALFVNDAPEDSVKTAEEINVQETFKKYANAFPAESPLPGDLPSLRERDDKKKTSTVNGSGRSNMVNKRGKPSSEEEDDDDDDDEDDMGSVSLENRSGYHSSRIEPFHGYREMQDIESGETASMPKESSEGILPPLVQKVKPIKLPVKDEDEEDDEDDSDESAEADIDEGHHIARSKPKGKKKGAAKPLVDDDESSEEDDIEVAEDDHQAPEAPWAPVYQMHKGEKQKKGHKKRQKGPYKGGEGPYDDIPHPGMPPAPSHSSGGVISSALNSLKKPWGSSSSVSQEVGQDQAPHHHHYPSSHSQEVLYGDHPYHHHGGPPPSALPYGGGPHPSSQEVGGGSEQKPGFFQSIMSWFTGSKGEQGAQHQQDSPYGPGGPQGPYGGQPPYGGGGSAEHHHHHRDDHNDRESATGAPWPSQPDPAGVGQFGQSYNYRHMGPASSEEDSMEEMLIDEPVKPKKKNKRRFRGRSDSIITAPPKKTSPAKKGKTTGGPPPPVVIVPKKSTKPSSQGLGAFEPNLHYEKLIQADGGLSSGGKKNIKPSNKEYKRTKKAAIKPKSNQNQTPSSSSTKKKQKKSSQKRRGSRESNEDDDDEVYSSEEIYNQQIAKLKTAGSMEIVSLGGGSSSSNGANNGGSSSNKNSNKNNGHKQQTHSFPNYFESMFGTEEKDRHAIKGKDDGSLLYGFDALSSTLNASPLELPAVTMKKTASTYKVNKNKKKQKKKGNSPPVKFNNKEAIRDSSEEDDKKK